MTNRRFHRMALVILALVVAALLATACAKAPAQPQVVEKPVVQIPPPDVAPNGCADCHKKEGDKDYTLSAEAKKANPNHVPLPATATVTDCDTCHGAPGKNGAKPFETWIHKVHLNSQTFSPKLKGYCNSCHVLNATTGLIDVKGLK
ncbi:MAG: hypothetical protein ACYC41_03405 [Bacillota bacterium]